MAGEEILFKKINNPVEFRKNLLEASKQLIHGLQKYESLKAVRTKKAEQIARLKSIVREINILNSKLKKEFPDLVFKIAKVKKASGEKTEKEAKKGVKKKENRELVDLERQLKEIEKKLENVS